MPDSKADRGVRPEGRVALSDFYQTKVPRPEGWEDCPVFALGLTEYRCKDPPETASAAVWEAYSFFFKGYTSNPNQEPYPHLISLRYEPLTAIVKDILEAKGFLDQNHGYPPPAARPTPAKVSPDRKRAILVSGDSRSYWPTIDPEDVDWNCMHYDERLLDIETYRRIINADPRAFLKALGHYRSP